MRMKRHGLAAMAAALLFAAAPLGADLKQAKAEPNLEKRSKLALDNAAAAFKEARAAYDAGDLDRTRGLIAETAASVELADTALRQTGKDPRRSPKWFKRAELETRELGRRIDSFQQEMSYTDRALLEKLKAQVQQVHEELLTGLMEGKRK
jgi:hypothetical protein